MKKSWMYAVSNFVFCLLILLINRIAVFPYIKSMIGEGVYAITAVDLKMLWTTLIVIAIGSLMYWGAFALSKKYPVGGGCSLYYHCGCYGNYGWYIYD